MGEFDKAKYDVEYKKTHCIRKMIQFNKNVPDDVRLLEWLESQPVNMNQYIKRLIQDDIDRHKDVWTIR